MYVSNADVITIMATMRLQRCAKPYSLKYANLVWVHFWKFHRACVYRHIDSKSRDVVDCTKHKRLNTRPKH